MREVYEESNVPTTEDVLQPWLLERLITGSTVQSLEDAFTKTGLCLCLCEVVAHFLCMTCLMNRDQCAITGAPYWI